MAKTCHKSYIEVGLFRIRNTFLFSFLRWKKQRKKIMIIGVNVTVCKYLRELKKKLTKYKDLKTEISRIRGIKNRICPMLFCDRYF